MHKLQWLANIVDPDDIEAVGRALSMGLEAHRGWLEGKIIGEPQRVRTPGGTIGPDVATLKANGLVGVYVYREQEPDQPYQCVKCNQRPGRPRPGDQGPGQISLHCKDIQPTPADEEAPSVILRISGGVIEVVDLSGVPEDTRIIIRDYDIDTTDTEDRDNAHTDDYGDLYIESTR